MITRMLRDRRAGVLPLVACALPTLLGLGAFAVDMGSVYTATRRLQGMADAAALAAAADPAHARGMVEATLAASDWSGEVRTALDLGTWQADRPVADRFGTGGGAGAAAVRVTLTADRPLFLATIFGRRGMTIARTATATAEPMAAFSIGTRLASLNGGVANALLSALVGGGVTLSVMDHRALLDADIDVFAFGDALRTRLRLTGASYDRVLAADMTSIDVIEAMAETLSGSGQAAVATALGKLRAGAAPAAIDLSRVIDLGPAGARDTAPAGTLARVSAGALLNAALGVADGRRQLTLNLGADIPGLSATRLWIATGDRPVDSPWLTVTGSGNPVIRTAQTRIYLETATGVPGLAEMRLPLLVELAEGEARLAAIACSGVAARAVTIDARPAPATLHLAEIDRDRLGDHRSGIVTGPARLLDLPLVSVRGQARVATGGAGGWTPVRFSQAEIDARSVKTVATRDVARSLTASLAEGLDLQVRALGVLPVNVAAVGGAVSGQLGVVAPAIDDVLNTVLATLGIGIGEADIRVSGMRCAQPVLVA